jgi:hypothetical protein
MATTGVRITNTARPYGGSIRECCGKAVGRPCRAARLSGSPGAGSTRPMCQHRARARPPHGGRVPRPPGRALSNLFGPEQARRAPGGSTRPGIRAPGHRPGAMDAIRGAMRAGSRHQSGRQPDGAAIVRRPCDAPGPSAEGAAHVLVRRGSGFRVESPAHPICPTFSQLLRSSRSVTVFSTSPVSFAAFSAAKVGALKTRRAKFKPRSANGCAPGRRTAYPSASATIGAK